MKRNNKFKISGLKEDSYLSYEILQKEAKSMQEKLKLLKEKVQSNNQKTSWESAKVEKGSKLIYEKSLKDANRVLDGSSSGKLFPLISKCSSSQRSTPNGPTNVYEAQNKVAHWLESLELSQYYEKFSKNDIKYATLSSITSDDLDYIGITVLGHRKAILNAVAKLNTKSLSFPSQLPEINDLGNPCGGAVRTHWSHVKYLPQNPTISSQEDIDEEYELAAFQSAVSEWRSRGSDAKVTIVRELNIKTTLPQDFVRNLSKNDHVKENEQLESSCFTTKYPSKCALSSSASEMESDMGNHEHHDFVRAVEVWRKNQPSAVGLEQEVNSSDRITAHMSTTTESSNIPDQSHTARSIILQLTADLEKDQLVSLAKLKSEKDRIFHDMHSCRRASKERVKLLFDLQLLNCDSDEYTNTTLSEKEDLYIFAKDDTVCASGDNHKENGAKFKTSILFVETKVLSDELVDLLQDIEGGYTVIEA